jgi:DNA-binding transcriptional regulator LsrR (DeoR family)
VLPTVFSGLEDLSTEIEKLLKSSEVKVEIRSRFNPCIYLAQYLMRNNPRFATE